MNESGAASDVGMLVVLGDPVAADLARTLDLAGYRWKAVSSSAEASDNEPSNGWAGAVVDVSGDSENGWAFARAIRKSDTDPIRTLILLGGGQIADLELRDELFDDFCLTPFHPAELEARLRHLLSTGSATVSRADMVEYGDLALNLETYQASIGGRPLDLTYMEYELLKFLAQNPGKVFTREMLLSRVWGYEYYGGAKIGRAHV